MSVSEPPDRTPVPTTIPLLEETAVVSAQAVPTGLTRVTTRTETVEHIANVALQADVVDVTRVPIGRVVDHAPDIRTEGDTTIVPILEEIVVVEKRLILKEEIHIRRRVQTETLAVPVTIRRQHAVVEHLDEHGQPKEAIS